MQEIKGKYVKDCKIYADTIEAEAMSTIYDICDNPAFKEQKIRIMPDCHQGKGIVIGFSSTLGDFVNPSHVGCDIGCTVSTMILNRHLNKEDYPLFEKRVRDNIPTGFDINKKSVIDEKDFFKFLRSGYSRAASQWGEMIDVPSINEKWVSDKLKGFRMDEGIFYKSLGTIGGGNHFMEYGETEDGMAAFTIHCGSRNFGLKVFKKWEAEAKRTPRNSSVYNVDEEIKKIKATVKDRTTWKKLIEDVHQHAKECNPSGYLSGERLKGYLNDMVFAQLYAAYNHIVIQNIIKNILLKFSLKPIDIITSTHNYIDFQDHIIRKGAIRAYEGEKMIIPFNMRDGLAICEGKSNEDWNCTAPHGAGRLLSRSKAKSTLNMKVFENEMKGIYSTSVCKSTLDESPMAYKDTDEIVNLINDTCKILYFIKPRINIKATEEVDE